jgi:hypothetical protein
MKEINPVLFSPKIKIKIKTKNKIQNKKKKKKKKKALKVTSPGKKT